MGTSIVNLSWTSYQAKLDQSGSRDITLSFDGKGFPLHKAVLSGHMGYFSDLFKQDVSISSLGLPASWQPAFAYLVKYIYKGSVDIPKSEVASVKDLTRLLRLKTSPSSVEGNEESSQSVSAETEEIVVIADGDARFGSRDVTVTCDRTVYPLHKGILSACSSVFAKIFSPDRNINCVDLRGIRSHYFEFLLHYIYKSSWDFLKPSINMCKDIAEVLKVAGFLQLKAIQFLSGCNEHPNDKSSSVTSKLKNGGDHRSSRSTTTTETGITAKRTDGTPQTKMVLPEHISEYGNSDVTLVCKGQSACLHKSVLSRSSDFFCKLFLVHESICAFEIKGIPLLSFKKFVKYMYTNAHCDTSQVKQLIESFNVKVFPMREDGALLLPTLGQINFLPTTKAVQTTRDPNSNGSSECVTEMTATIQRPPVLQSNAGGSNKIVNKSESDGKTIEAKVLPEILFESEAKRENGPRDVKIFCKGTIYCLHKSVLTRCSEYLEGILSESTCGCLQINGVEPQHLEMLFKFMYHGTLEIDPCDLDCVKQAGEALKVVHLPPLPQSTQNSQADNRVDVDMAEMEMENDDSTSESDGAGDKILSEDRTIKRVKIAKRPRPSTLHEPQKKEKVARNSEDNVIIVDSIDEYLKTDESESAVVDTEDVQFEKEEPDRTFEEPDRAIYKKRYEMAYNTKKWSDQDTQVLIDVWRDNIVDLKSMTRKHRIYCKMAMELSNLLDSEFTSNDVKGKIQNLTKQYRREMTKLSTGSGPSVWRYCKSVDSVLKEFPLHSQDTFDASTYDMETTPSTSGDMTTESIELTPLVEEEPEKSLEPFNLRINQKKKSEMHQTKDGETEKMRLLEEKLKLDEELRNKVHENMGERKYIIEHYMKEILDALKNYS